MTSDKAFAATGSVSRRHITLLGAALAVTHPPVSFAAVSKTPDWRIGDVRITRLPDFEMARDPAVSTFPFATPEVLAAAPWLQPRFIDRAGLLRFNFQGFLLETPTRRILVDTGLGPRPAAGAADMGRMMDVLAASGHSPDSIDTVVHTHLHPDHAGWDARTVDGRVAPTFAKARYVIAQPEYDYWSRGQTDATARQGFANALAPFLASRQLDLVAADHSLAPEVSLMATPGHTPGHVSVRIASRGERAVITGDLLHHPVQFMRPDWNNPSDHDGAVAVRTRTAFCAAMADAKVLVIGSHFATPTAGWVEASGSAYRFVV